MDLGLFLSLFDKFLRNEIDSLSESLTLGSPQTLEAYREQVGQMRALLLVGRERDRIIKEMQKDN